MLNQINFFEEEISKKIQEAEMQKQLIDEKIKDSNIDNAEIDHFVLNMIKIFMADQDEEVVIKNLYEVIELCRKKTRLKQRTGI